jgi:hypothetical protein
LSFNEYTMAVIELHWILTEECLLWAIHNNCASRRSANGHFFLDEWAQWLGVLRQCKLPFWMFSRCETVRALLGDPKS